MATADEVAWAEPGLRQVMIQQIEDTYRVYGNPTRKPSQEVERHILEKAQSRDDYLQMGARLILHIKEVKGSRQQNQVNAGGVQATNTANAVNQNILTQQLNAKIQQQQQQQLVLNQQGANQNQLLQQQQQQQILVNKLANATNNATNVNQALSSNMGQPIQVSMQGGQIINQRNLGQQAVGTQQQFVVSQAQIQNQLGGMNIINSSSGNLVLPNQVYLSTQQQQQQQVQQAQQQLQLKQQQQNQQQQQQTLLQQQQQQQQGKQPSEQEQLIIKQLQQNKRQQLINQQNATLQSNSTPTNTAMGFNLPKTNVSKSTIGNVPQPSPAKNISAPSPQGQPSPLMQPTPSPAFINPPSVGPAPSPLTHVDEQAYVEKLKEMSKYIEPLAKLINRMPKDDGRAEHVKERNKMNGLLDMLNNKNRRVPLNVLGKCENVLRRLFPDVSAAGLSTATPDTSTVDLIPTPVAKPQSALQPMGEVVTNVINSAHIMSDTQQNILPGMLALNAPMITPPLPPSRKFRKRHAPSDEGRKKSPLPRALQMEIVTLCNRFDMMIDRTKPVDSAGLTMLCKLRDDSIPVTISSLSILIRPNYPTDQPEYMFATNGDNDLMNSNIRKLLQKKLTRLPTRITFTTILNTWEQSLYDCYVDT